MATKRKSKTEKARRVFDKYYGEKTRGEILKKLTGKAVGLTPGGASTYYANMLNERKKAEA